MARRRNRSSSVVGPSDPLRRRCVRLARRGEYRKAAVALRALVARDNDAASWVRLGVMLLRARKIDDGIDALKQGLWLHKRARATARVEVVERLIREARVGWPSAA